jgi:hypothetical protein
MNNSNYNFLLYKVEEEARQELDSLVEHIHRLPISNMGITVLTDIASRFFSEMVENKLKEITKDD